MSALVGGLVIGGCGGGSGGPPSSSPRSGRLQVNVTWPGRSRMIPKSANQIVLSLRDKNGADTVKALYRSDGAGARSVEFPGLAPGAYILAAAAFPNETDAPDAAQAITLRPVQVNASGTTSLNLSLDTTITRLELEGVPQDFVVGETDTVVARAYDRDGNFVITYEKAIRCESNNPDVIRIKNDENAFDIEALAPGVAILEVTDTETGLSARAAVEVLPPGPRPAPNTLILSVGDIAYSAATGRLYASVRSDDPARGRSLAIINPATQQIEQSVLLGGEPGPLAVSDDGRYVYVGLTGTGMVARYNVAEARKDLEFPVGSSPDFGTLDAEQIAVMPGNAETIAVSRTHRKTTTPRAGVAIFDNGVMRARVTPNRNTPNRIVWADPTRIYGHNNEDSEWGFYRLTVDSDGAVVQDVLGGTGNPLFNSSNIDITFAGDRIFATAGQVIDPNTRTVLGKFAPVGSFFGGPVAPDVARNRVFFATGSRYTYPGVTIEAFDTNTFGRVGEVLVPNVNGNLRRLVRWGEKGLILGTDEERIHFIPEAPGL